MKEQLISSQTANLAKAKGYNIFSRNFFAWEGDKVYSSEQSGDYDDLPGIERSWGPVVFAPTQSLLQRWIREVHQMHLTVHYHKSRKFSVSVEDEVENSLDLELFGNFYDTYEEALECGLVCALNLIP